MFVVCVPCVGCWSISILGDKILNRNECHVYIRYVRVRIGLLFGCAVLIQNEQNIKTKKITIGSEYNCGLQKYQYGPKQ
jgi:hypothetical protein